MGTVDSFRLLRGANSHHVLCPRSRVSFYSQDSAILMCVLFSMRSVVLRWFRVDGVVLYLSSLLVMVRGDSYVGVRAVGSVYRGLMDDSVPIFLFRSGIIPSGVVHVMRVFSFRVFHFRAGYQRVISMRCRRYQFPSLLSYVSRLSSRLIRLVGFVCVMLPYVSLAFVFRSNRFSL